jgi:tRNA nucleotidyltransferase (CCA-adding enzyme)
MRSQTLRDRLLALFPALRSLPPNAYVVGGAVRDLLLGAHPADIDVACLDPQACARTLRRKVIRLGREEHVSAYRVVDGAHVYDFAALLDGSIDADLGRRDFTINAMAVDLAGGALLDPYGGRRDLAARLVRMVDAKNFDDDPLRMLKAIRMAVRLDFAIDAATVAAIRPRAAAIAGVAAERVAYELSVIFAAGAFRRAVALLRQTELDVPLFGRELEAARFHADDVPLAAAFAILVDDPPSFAERWKWSDAMLRDVLTLQRIASDRSLMPLYDAGARLAAQLPPMLRALGHDDDVAMPDFAVKPLLTGDEIAHLAKIEPGPRVGAIKRALLEAQLRGEVRTREKAEAFVTASR